MAAGKITRSGFVGLIGRPNVGKSTLLNHILGQKLVIASQRPQTTRDRVIGVHNVPGAQSVRCHGGGPHRPGSQPVPQASRRREATMQLERR